MPTRNVEPVHRLKLRLASNRPGSRPPSIFYSRASDLGSSIPRALHLQIVPLPHQFAI